MIKVAKLFPNGSSQAIRLPKEFRFINQEEVYIKKSGQNVILIPKDKEMWQDWFKNLESFSKDFIHNIHI